MQKKRTIADLNSNEVAYIAENQNGNIPLKLIQMGCVSNTKVVLKMKAPSSMKKFVLIGNPNTGKTSLFNSLTGLNQSTGNYPGITVDRKIGKIKTSNEPINLIDLPGTYSLEPNSIDEEIVLKEILNIAEPIDAIIYVADPSNLRRNLLLFSQIRDLEIPCILVLNRIDKLKENGRLVAHQKLSDTFKCPVVLTSIKKSLGLDKLKESILQLNAACSYQSKFELKNEENRIRLQHNH